MTVEEIIDELEALDREDRGRVRRALERLEVEDDRPIDPAAHRRAMEAWRRLEQGLVEGDGRCLSEGIDEALYGRDA